MTVERRTGGASDPARPGHEGPLLHLRCRVCGAHFWWDFFKAASADPP